MTKEGKKRDIFGYDNSNVFELVYQTFERWMNSTRRERCLSVIRSVLIPKNWIDKGIETSGSVSVKPRINSTRI